MTNGYNTPIGVPIGLPSILSLGLPPLINPYPTLNLDFINNPQFDSRITFSRGSQATLFDSTGTLRYAKHNLLTYSQPLNTGWVKFGTATVTDNNATAPDGAVAAALISSPATGDYIYQAPTTVIGQSYIFSVFVKNSTATISRLWVRTSSTAADILLNWSGATLSSVTQTTGTATFTAVGNDWYRVFVTYTAVETAARHRIYGGDATSTTGNILVWGVQVNATNMEGGVTSSLTTYYPTTTAAYYAPRFDYNPSTLAAQGLLIEEARTNSIRNNTMQGAVAGTPGTLPTNWTAAGQGTLTREIVGTGTDNGITYVDIRYSGTTSTTAYALLPEGLTQIVAASGQTWTSSFYLKLQAGSTTNITSISNQIRGYDSGGIIQESNGSSVVLTSTLTRFSHTYTLANAGSVRVVNALLFSFSSGVSIDITLRIGLPQLELGASATSVIPTTTTALTRNADVASMTGTNFSSWYNQSEGTFVTTTQLANTSAANRAGFDVNDNSTNNRIIFRAITTGGGDQVTIRSGGSTVATLSNVSTPTTATRKTSVAYKVDDFAFTANGVAPQTDTLGAVPVAPTQILIGSAQAGTEYLGGYIQRLSFYPQRLPNASLQALTA